MRFCCGSSLTTNLYAIFEAGKFRKTPTTEDITESIRWARSTGFEAIEFSVLTKEQLDSTFNKEGLESISRASKLNDVRIPHVSFPFVSGIFPSQSNLKELRRLLPICAELTSGVGADIFQIHSPPVPGTESAWDVAYPGGPARKISFHWGGDWNKTWELYVQWIGEMCDTCRDRGLKLAIEARPREIISNTDVMLSLLKDVRASNLGVIFDTGHHFIMREILPISIWKLDSFLYSVQLSDNDGIVEYQWAPGEGKIDWKALVEALESVNYRGYLVIEASGLRQQLSDFVRARHMIESLLGKTSEAVESREEIVQHEAIFEND